MLTALDNLTIETQGTHEEWCWASVTAGVSQFLDKRPYTIDAIVQSVVPGCGGDGDPMCDIPWPLEDALSAMHHLDHHVTGPISYLALQQALIDLNRPVAIGITFSTRLGTILHYCLVAGCSDDGSNELMLLNPALPDPCEYSISYADLVQGSVLDAVWTSSFFVI